MLLNDRNFSITFFYYAAVGAPIYTSIFLGFFGHGRNCNNRKGGTLPLQHHLGEHSCSMPQVNYLLRMQITSMEVGCLGVDVMRKVEDSVKNWELFWHQFWWETEFHPLFFFFPERLHYCYIYFHYSCLYNHYNYS
jgi:hypothetical protein